ncbi:MAG: dihydrolipoyl dehydrogenase [gamma proteobacterium symbiont of Taylorina sp.]|nr:dihydrolipoyl dehydrogenase [gamma proteobacterium symbiont of Taylorina sp.]
MSDNKNYDVVVIGAGPAGYVAAIRCSQLGLKTACVDNWQDEDGKHHLGGTCLNVGCIPSKALLDSSEHYYQLNNEFAEHGIKINQFSLNIAQMMARKNNITRQLSSGINTLFAANNIDLHSGTGQLQENNRIAVIPMDSSAQHYVLEGENIILATGSQAMDIPAAPIDNKNIVDSTGALSFTEVPKRLAIIGAGVIGLELGSVWNRLGSKVILLEAQEEFLPIADRLLASEALRHFNKQGLDIRLGARVTSSSIGKKQITVSYQDKQKQKRIVVDRVLVAVGRTPHTKNLFAANVNLLLDEGGFIDVDKYCRTNLPDVYAVGDIVRGPMLAHKGSEEGICVAETIAGNKKHINMNLIPAVVYTLPEIAWVGKTEQVLLKEDIPFKSGIFPFAANGRAKAMSADSGQLKVLSHAKTDKILGVHIIGPFASEILQTAVIAMEFEGSAEDLARSIFAHPSLSEALHEAALAVDNRAIHAINRG